MSSLVGSVVLWMAVGTLQAEPLSVQLGPVDQEHGLAVPSSGDGKTAPETLAGSPCRRITGPIAHYMYVRADSSRLPRGRYDAWLTVEFFDDQLGIARVEYDKAAATPRGNPHYAVAEDGILLLRTGQWQRAVVHLPEARFAHGQNGGADLRLGATGMVVRRIEIAFQRPAEYGMDGIDRTRVEKAHARIGAGLDLDFGDDPTPTEAALLRALGATSAESYVSWESVEGAGRDRWDWSRWDRQVEILRRAGLKWAPLLVAGPAYATPRWFRESADALPYVCLEHGKATKIQSLWNPRLRPWIERFIKAFADHYRDRGVLEMVRLGVSGIYGETLYPTTMGTDWACQAVQPIHCHSGWWAGDYCAVESFRRALRGRYGDIDALNRAWGTRYPGFDHVLPTVPDKSDSLRARMDFINWYLDSMTEFSAFWAGVTRKHLPNTPIYLCVGGSGERMFGADFTAQAKAVAPYGLRLRVTNEGSDYDGNFAITREVVTACRAYGLDIGIEPAGPVTASGNIARIYNASASGAVHLFCYNSNVFQSPDALERFYRCAPMFQRRVAEVPAAVYLSKTSWALDEESQGRTFTAVRRLRHSADLEMLDENTLRTPLARKIRVLAVPDAPYAEAADIAALGQWVAEGGILVVGAGPHHRLLTTPEGSTAGCRALLALPPGDTRLVRMTTESPTRHFRLEIGRPGDDDYLWGDWYTSESWRILPDRPGMRWTAARAGIHVPCDPASDATLVLTAGVRRECLAGPNRILVNGTPVGTLDQPGVREHRFAVAKSLLAGRRVAEVVLDVRAEPASTVGDYRRLGLMAGRIEMFSRGAEAAPPIMPSLVAQVDWSQAATCIRHIGKGATATVPGEPHQIEAVFFEALTHPEKLGVAGRGAAWPPARVNGVFVTQCADGALYYNANSQAQTVGGVEVPAEGIAWAPKK